MIKFHSACRMTLVTAELPGSDPGAPWCTPIHQVSFVQPTAKTSHFPSPFHLPQRPAQPPPSCQLDRKCWHQCPRLRFPGAGGENLRKRWISKWKIAHWETWMKCFRCCFCCSVAKSCPTVCNPMGSSTPSSSALHYLLEFSQTHVCRVSGAIQPSHPLMPLYPFAFNLFQHQRLFQWVSSSYSGQRNGVSASASVLSMNSQGWFPLGLTGLISFQSKGLSRIFSSTTIQKHQYFGAQPSLWPNSHIYTWLLE